MKWGWGHRQAQWRPPHRGGSLPEARWHKVLGCWALAQALLLVTRAIRGQFSQVSLEPLSFKVISCIDPELPVCTLARQEASLLSKLGVRAPSHHAHPYLSLPGKQTLCHICAHVSGCPGLHSPGPQANGGLRGTSSLPLPTQPPRHKTKQQSGRWGHCSLGGLGGSWVCAKAVHT